MTETTSTHGAPRSLLAFLREGRGGSASAPASGAQGAKRGWGPKRLIALGLMILIPLIGLLGATSASADDNDMKFAFYKVSSSTTALFSTVQEPGSDETFSAGWKQVISDPGSAGSLLGYADPDFSISNGWLASKLSGSSDAIGYETLQVRDDDADTTSTRYQGMVDYAYYGAALKGLGLDSTSTGLSLSFMSVLSGSVIMMLYILSGAVDFVFNAFIGLLTVLNPFKLFYAGVAAVSPDLASGMVGDGIANDGPLSGLVSWIGGWYQTLVSLSWAVLVPLFIVVLVAGLFLFKKMDRGGAVKKIVIRMIFIGLGLPLLGSMYTGMITSMSDATAEGNAGSTRVVMSTYVDFEGWVMKSRLAIPEGAKIAWVAASAQPSGPAMSEVRNTALAINNATHNMNLSSIVTGEGYDASWSNQIMEGKVADAATSSRTFSTTVDVLARYISAAQLSAAAFETSAKGKLTQSEFYDANKNSAVATWFDSVTKDAKGLNEDSTAPQANPLVAVTEGTGLHADGTGIRTFSSNTTGCSVTGTKMADNDGTTRACNLSPLSMFNYLNTDFGSTSMTMYSSSNAASEATRPSHNSVNQVGTGTMSFLYWFNAVVLLGSFVLIGLGYAFSLVFSSIKRSIQIVTAVPFATLGALAAIAKVIVYSVALILEVIVTIFVYKLVQEILTSLPQIIEMPFAAILNGDGPLAGFVAFLTSGWAFGMVVTLLSIIGIVIFTVLAMRIRKVLVKAVEETVTKLVEKFMDTQVGMPGGGGLAPALAGGVAAGAGAAAANRMMSGGLAKGAIGGGIPGGGDGGPEAVKTAGGAVPTGPGADGGAEGQLEITGGEAGAIGNGDPGNSPDGSNSDGSKNAADDVALGRQIEANGLSKPGPTAAPQVGGDDAMSAASNSVDKAADGYKAADTKQLEAGKEGAQATGHAAIAVGRGFAGDGVGAAESGGKALQHGGAAAASSEQSKQLQSDAGRSSLDKPDQTHSRNAAKAQQVSKVGGAVAGVAGTAGGVSGGKPSVSKGTSQAKAPATAKPAPARQSPQQAPKQTAAPAPKQTQAPRPTQQKAPEAPKQAPVKQAPVKQPAPQRAPQAPRPQAQPKQPLQQTPKPPAPRPVQRAPRPPRKDENPPK